MGSSRPTVSIQLGNGPVGLFVTAIPRLWFQTERSIWSISSPCALAGCGPETAFSEPATTSTAEPVFHTVCDFFGLSRMNGRTIVKPPASLRIALVAPVLDVPVAAVALRLRRPEAQ